MVVSIFHLLPADRIGGVEIAASTTLNINNDFYKFRVLYLFKKRNNSFSFMAKFKFFINTVSFLFKEKSYILITSLWKSNVIAILLTILKKDVKLIVFLHSPINAHFFDRVATRLSIFFAKEIWVDSQATLKGRLNRPLLEFKNKKIRIISFMSKRLKPFANSKCSPNFIFWGRLDNIKRIDKAINFFYQISLFKKGAKFIIIGPDCGGLGKITKIISNLNLQDKVLIKNPMHLNEIRQLAAKATFFIQLSRFEGMGMSVIEAMQIGLIPIVTPVGEIGSYCKDGFNSIIFDIDNNKLNLKKVIDILNNSKKYEKIRFNSLKTWENMNTYKEDIKNSCMELSLGNN